jgi:hypothetical protein
VAEPMRTLTAVADPDEGLAHGAPASPDVQALAAALVGALADDPALLNALADLVVDKLAASRGFSAAASEEDPAPGDTAWEVPSERSAEVASWALTEHPELIAGSADTWAAAMVSASGLTHPRDVIGWARSPDCETDYWRSIDGALVAPKPTRTGSPKAGAYTQMLREYRTAHRGGGAAVVAGIDALVNGVSRLVAECGVAKSSEPSMAWRRNAIAVIEVCGSAEQALTAIGWALQKKPFWRSNVQGVPTERSFRKLYSDYRQTGASFDLERDGGEYAESTRALVNGWVFYLRPLLPDVRVKETSTSLARAFKLLAGEDDYPPLPLEEAKLLVKWILDPTADRARFYADGTDFPPPPKAYKALVAMRGGDAAPRARGGMGAGVAVTNAVAGDGGASAAGSTTITVKGI